MKEITLIIPVYNEAGVIEKNLQAILEEIRRVEEVQFHVLLVDDGSEDGTAEILGRICANRAGISFLCLNRHFGKEAALLAGMHHAESDAAIIMDSDLQHPPALIAGMVRAWLSGAEVVEAYKINRGRETVFRRFLANGFYKLFQVFSGIDLKNHSDFKLLDRKVIEAYRSLPEKTRFFRGLIPWLGFSSVQIPFEVPERDSSATRWSRRRLFRMSVSAITSFSTIPLQLITFLGGLTFLLSAVLGSTALYQKFTGQAVSGFTTVILLLLFIGSVLMLGIGLIGVYLARIYEEIKSRPPFIIDWSKSRYPGKGADPEE